MNHQKFGDFKYNTNNNDEQRLYKNASVNDTCRELNKISKFNQDEEDKKRIKDLKEIIQFSDVDEGFKNDCKMMLKMLELKSLQAKIREKVLKRYKNGNLPPEVGFRDAQTAFKALTMGDKMYESVLVDRNFYRRTAIFTSQHK